MNLDPLDRPIETPRFTLRLISDVDLDGLFAVHGDDEATRFIPSASWHERADALAWLARNATMHDEGKSRRWAIVDREGGRPIGDCMLFNFDAASSRAEIGFVLGRRDWGRGAVYEAVGALLDTAFSALDLRRVEAYADVRNRGSDRALKRLGFAHEGTLRQRAMFKGEVRDSNVYGLLRDEWFAARAA